jgi:tRNA pseudouridine38-40 synthase
MKGLNSLLPKDVAVMSVVDMESNFDARKSASSRRYRYLIYNGAVASPFSRNYAWHLYKSLEVDAMREAGVSLLGVHDFSSFVGGKNETESTVRDLISLSVERMSGDFISIEVVANAFLRHMVRNIVGTLVDVGWGKTEVDQMKEILDARDRAAAGITAPAKGLYLVEVKYL